MKVIQHIQSTMTPSEPPVNVTYYSGDSLAQAMGAVAQAMTDVERPDAWFKVLAITVEF